MGVGWGWGGWEGESDWRAPCLAAQCLAEQVVLFIFLHFIYKIMPFPKTALGLKHDKYRHRDDI